VPERAEWAAEHFFRSGNLFALRELALRVTAERISAEVLVYRKGHAIEATWPKAERLLVSAKLIRAAKRASAARHVSWIAAFVESPRLSDAQRQSAAKNLRLAEKLDAETTSIAGPRVSEEIVALARSKNVSTIIIGNSIRFLGAIFDIFCRAPGEKPPRGYGLGLAICRAVAHGGNTRAENRPKGGSRFIVTLPLDATSPGSANHDPDADNDFGH